MRSGGAGGNTARLLRLAQSGDASALEQLLLRVRKDLSLAARTQIGRRLQGKADPADLVQDALLEIHRQFGKFRGQTAAEFHAWSRRILAGLTANHVRRYLGTKQRDARLEKSLIVELNNSARALHRDVKTVRACPSEQAVQKESQALLADALGDLPEHYRKVIVLRYLHEMQFPEVARRMRRSIDSVEKLWARALRQLRVSLAEKNMTNF